MTATATKRPRKNATTRAGFRDLYKKHKVWDRWSDFWTPTRSTGTTTTGRISGASRPTRIAISGALRPTRSVMGLHANVAALKRAPFLHRFCCSLNMSHFDLMYCTSVLTCCMSIFCSRLRECVLKRIKMGCCCC